MEPSRSPGPVAGTPTLDRPADRPAGSAETTAPQESPPAPKEQIRAATETLKHDAGEALQSAKAAGDNFLREQKQRLAGKLDDYTAALDAACESLQEQDSNPLAGPAKRAARGLEQAAGYLRDTSRQDLLQDLGELARRRPEWIYGALFIGGLAAARFLKATPPRPAAASPRTQLPPARTPHPAGTEDGGSAPGPTLAPTLP